MNSTELGTLIKILIPNVEERIWNKIENSNLTDRELKILRYRIIDNLTLVQVGKMMGVTRERIRQIEAKAFRKLRHPDKRFADVLESKDINYYKNLMNKFFNTVEINVNKREQVPETEEEVLKGISIEELALSLRAYNCLKRAGINTVYDLQSYTIEDMKKIDNLGKNSLEEIVEKVENIPLFTFKGEE